MRREIAPLSESTGHASRMTAAVEAMIYVAIFAVAMAFAVALFGAAAAQAHEARMLERAVELACEQAEAFAADPEGTVAPLEDGSLTAECSVEREARPFGFLYKATITVLEGDAGIYQRDALCYLSQRGEAVGDGAAQ